MFRKRPKKFFPPGTFIPAPARLMAILQLCLVFTILIWNASEPFMGDLFTIKSKMLIYQHVLGVKNPDNVQRFNNLPEIERSKIIQAYDSLRNELDKSFLVKLKQSVKQVLFEIPAL